MLFLTDGAVSQRLDDYELCAVLFDGNDEAALPAARQQWPGPKANDQDRTYWQHDAHRLCDNKT